jgi:hypothetical protein
MRERECGRGSELTVLFGAPGDLQGRPRKALREERERERESSQRECVCEREQERVRGYKRSV